MNVRPDVEAMVSGAYGQEGTVLVDVVQLVDAPERIIAAFVWLERVNRVYSVLGVRLPSMVRRKNLWPTFMKVSVWEKTINRLIQSGDSIGNTFAPALERLFDRNELISRKQKPK